MRLRLDLLPLLPPLLFHHHLHLHVRHLLLRLRQMREHLHLLLHCVELSTQAVHFLRALLMQLLLEPPLVLDVGDGKSRGRSGKRHGKRVVALHELVMLRLRYQLLRRVRSQPRTQARSAIAFGRSRGCRRTAVVCSRCHGRGGKGHRQWLLRRG